MQELYCLPNEQPMADFEKPAVDILRRLPLRASRSSRSTRSTWTKLEDEHPHDGGVEQPAARSLAQQLDRLLCDQINDGDESEPVLREFWRCRRWPTCGPRRCGCGTTVKFGDPLYLVKQFGRGRVTVMITDAGGRSRVELDRLASGNGSPAGSWR